MIQSDNSHRALLWASISSPLRDGEFPCKTLEPAAVGGGPSLEEVTLTQRKQDRQSYIDWLAGDDSVVTTAPASLTVPSSIAMPRDAKALAYVGPDVALGEKLLADALPGPSTDPECMTFRLTHYPDGIRAVFFAGRAPPDPNREKKSREPKGECDRFESSVTRARSRLRHLARCMQVDHLWTFGKRGKFESLDEAWAVWKEFSRLMGVRFGDRWKYIVVPELHADKESFHLHAAVHGFFMATTLRSLWQRALGARGDQSGPASLGNVDAQDKRGLGSARRVANYIAKYVGKGFESVPACRRLFASSTGVRALEEWTFHLPYWLQGVETVDVVETFFRSRGFRWDGEVRKYGVGDFYCFVMEAPA